MGMRVGGAASSAAMSAWQTRRQDFGSLVSAIKSGDLGSAQQALSTLQSLNGSSTGGTTASASPPDGSSSANNGPLAAIGQALAGGDIKAAQQALANAFNGSGSGHHHHHGGGAGSATGTAQPASLPAGTTISTMA